MTTKKLLYILGLVAAVLAVPAVGMLFTDEINWTISDFLVAGTILTLIGIGHQVIVTKLSGSKRTLFTLLTIGVLLVIWAELAVGIISF